MLIVTRDRRVRNGFLLARASPNVEISCRRALPLVNPLVEGFPLGDGLWEPPGSALPGPFIPRPAAGHSWVRSAGLRRSRFSSRHDINADLFEPELLVDVADLEAISLVQPRFQAFQVFQAGVGCPGLEAGN